MKIGIIGSGNMGTALAGGFIAAGIVENAAGILVSSPDEPSRVSFASQVPGAQVFATNDVVAQQADVVIIAVKPQIVGPAIHSFNLKSPCSKLFISIAAGVKIASLESFLSESGVENPRVVRVMPNTGALVLCSASTFALGSHATEEDAATTQRLFGAVGLAERVPESLIDAATGLAGSGPAFVAAFIEAMSDGGVAAGIPRDLATKLAVQTVLGTSQMLKEKNGMHTGQLKDMVCSPGGTTIEGVYKLEKGGMRGAVMDAVRSAAEKAQALGNKK